MGTDTSYESYHGMVANVNTALVNMAQLCGKLKLDEMQDTLKKSQEHLTHNCFSVGIMGEFKRGKSTVINAMLGQEIMPADVVPTSATMNRVTYDTVPHAKVIGHDGSVLEIPVDKIGEYVTKTNKENEARAAKVDQAIVYYPCPFCQNGVDIVDTPGLNDDDRMDKISEEIIPKLDAVIVVVSAIAPFSESEAEFVRNKLMVSDVGRVIFVVNQIDLIRREKDRVRVVQEIRDRVVGSVLEKAKALYTEDSPEYKEAAAKMGSLRIYPISALDALEGRMEHDEELVNGSGIRQFEEGLTYLLTAERGILQLLKPVQSVTAAYGALVSSATALKDSQLMDAQTFQKQHEEALESLKQLQMNKKNELKKIKSAKQETLDNLAEQADGFYANIERELNNTAEQIGATFEHRDLKDKKYQEVALAEISNALSKVLSECSLNFSELMMAEAQRVVNERAESCAKFLGEATVSTQEIKMSFSPDVAKMQKEQQSKDFMSSVVGVFAEAATTYMGIAGIGGAIEGFKKGGVLGGIAGLAAGLGTVLLFTATPLVGLPFVVVSSIASSMAGRVVGNLFDKGDRAYNEMMSSVKEQIVATLTNLRAGRQIENALQENITTSFDNLYSTVNEEAERILGETQQTIDQMKENLSKDKFEREKITKDCEEIIAKANEIMEAIQPTILKIQSARKNG